jgi:hypothetical protein
MTNIKNTKTVEMAEIIFAAEPKKSPRIAYASYKTEFLFEEGYNRLMALGPMQWLSPLKLKQLSNAVHSSNVFVLSKNLYSIIGNDIKENIATWLIFSDEINENRLYHLRPQYDMVTKQLVQNQNVDIGLREGIVSWLYGALPTTTSSPDCINYFGDTFEFKMTLGDEEKNIETSYDLVSATISGRTITSRIKFKVEGTAATVLSKCKNGLVWAYFDKSRPAKPDWVVEISAEYLLNEMIMISSYAATDSITKTISLQMVLDAIKKGGAKDISQSSFWGVTKSLDHYRVLSKSGFAIENGLIDF